MASRVIHYSDIENYYGYCQENGSKPKTLCNREMTGAYHFSRDVTRVTCSRCIKRLEKLQMMAGQSNGETLRITTASDIGSCGDEQHDLYLSRLGIC